MIEKLQNLIEEIDKEAEKVAQKRADLEAQDDSAAIEADVAAYRARVAEEYAQRKASALYEVDVEARCWERIKAQKAAELEEARRLAAAEGDGSVAY